MSKSKVRVGITAGDPNGVGVEVIVKMLKDSRLLEHFTPVIYASNSVINAHKKAIHANDVNFFNIKNADEAKANKANLVNCFEGEYEVEFGKESKEAGNYAFLSLKMATEDLASGKTDVLVTAPIHKKTIQQEGFDFPGHTEYLANYSNTEKYLMFLVSGTLRVGVVTGHLPLKEVAKNLSKKSIEEKIEIMNQSLIADFGIRKPKIAVLGLNPHAGDNGLMGEEESTIIKPAIESAKKAGSLVFGPYAADGLFGSENLKNFDGVLAMYHDQGLAPFKALAFGTGINFTAGLPIVRTSPDHGTAFDIAGQNKASEDSIRAAIYEAIDIFTKRSEYKELTSNALEIRKA